MNLQAEKIELTKMLLNTESIEVIQKIKAILTKEETDWWDELSENEKADVEKGISQLAKGQGIAHEEVMKTHGKWLKK